MKRITIDVYNKNDLLGELIEIKSDDYEFIYVTDDNGQGFQCEHEDGTDKHTALAFRAARIADLVIKIEKSLEK